MAFVSPQDTSAMARLMQIMEGKTPTEPMTSRSQEGGKSSPQYVEVNGPGVLSRGEIDAMASVMNRLNAAMNQTTGEMITESARDPELKAALQTQVNESGVKIGAYQIVVNQDDDRLVNKQSFSVVNKLTGETLANELGLYEAAHGLVKLLNAGNFVNSPQVRKLLEAESTYTSQKLDAMRYRRGVRKAQEVGDEHKENLYESRRQHAMDVAMQAKAEVKNINKNIL